MTAQVFISGMITGVAITLALVTAMADQGGPTDAEIMQMIPAYCGKDGCQ